MEAVVSDTELVDIIRKTVNGCGGCIPLSSFFSHRPELKRVLGDRKLKAFLEEYPEVFEISERRGDIVSYGGKEGLMVRVKGIVEGGADLTPAGKTAINVLEKVLVSEVARAAGEEGKPIRVSYMSVNFKVRKKLRACYALAPDSALNGSEISKSPGSTEAQEKHRIGMLFAFYLLHFAGSRPELFDLSHNSEEKDPRCEAYHVPSATGRCVCNTYIAVRGAALEEKKPDSAKKNEEELKNRVLSLLRGTNPKKGVDIAWMGQDNKIKKCLKGRPMLQVLKTFAEVALSEEEGKWIVRSSAAPTEPKDPDGKPLKRRKIQVPGVLPVENSHGNPVVGLAAVCKPPKVSTEEVLRQMPVSFSISRLDKDTSGTLIYATSKEAEEHMKEQYAKKVVGKVYVAMCCGVPKAEGRVESKLLLSDAPGKNRVRVHKNGKLSITEYKVVRTYRRPPQAFPNILAIMRCLAAQQPWGLTPAEVPHVLNYLLPSPTASEKFSLLDVNPLTGRTHQIRVHMSSIGHPLTTDPKYSKKSKALAQGKWCPRHFLHCSRVEGVDQEGNPFRFETELPDDLKKALKSLIPMA